jgi:hypothetical protein
MASLGDAQPGPARLAADGSTELRKCSLLLSLERVDRVGSGQMRLAWSVGRGPALGAAIAADGSTEAQVLPAALFGGWIWLGAVRHASAWSALERSGDSCRRQHRRLRLPLLLSFGGQEARPGWRGYSADGTEVGCSLHGIWRGRIGAGNSNADGSTGGLWLLCCSLWKVDAVGSGRGSARLAGYSCRRQHGGAFGLSLLLSLGGRVGSGQRPGEARCGDWA